MAKRLVFDRVISLYISDNQRTNVPSGELWKVTCTIGLNLNGFKTLSEATSHLVGGGNTLGIGSDSAYVVGIAFKVVEV